MKQHRKKIPFFLFLTTVFYLNACGVSTFSLQSPVSIGHISEGSDRLEKENSVSEDGSDFKEPFSAKQTEERKLPQEAGNREKLHPISLSRDSVSVSALSENSLSEDSISEDSISEDSLSADILSEEESFAEEPYVPNIIVDTDLGNDADDAAALRVVTALAKAGRVNLKAVMSSATDDSYPKACHAMLCYDGFADVPVGYTTHICELDPTYTWGLAIPYFEGENYHLAESTELYKAVLRELAAKDEHCTIVVLGFLVNIDKLLKDPEGYALVQKTVDAIWFDGGVYPGRGTDFNFCWRGEVTSAAMYVCDNCPVPIVFVTNSTGVDDGDVIVCGRSFPELDPYNLDPVHIAYNAMQEESRSLEDQDLWKDLSGGHFAFDAITAWAGCLTTKADIEAMHAANLPKGQSRIALEENQLFLQPIEAHIYENGCNEFFPVAGQSRRYVAERAIKGLDWYEDQMDFWINSMIK